jgi:hypothetical protein
LHNGYQSWSYTGVETIPGSIEERRGTATHGGDDEDTVGEVAGVSWWWTFVADRHDRGAVIGATGGTVLKSYLAVDSARLRLVQGVTGDRITLAPGETRALDGIYLAIGRVSEELEHYAAVVAAAHPPAAPRHPALGGFGTWNLYYDEPSASLVREEAQFMKSELVPRGLTDLLLDDGYEPRWGEWSADPSFGAALDALNGEQTALGLRPALWLAPVYVDVTDPLVAQHPDWFVRRAGGALRTFNNFGPDYAALDAAVPEARAHVVQVVQRLRAWGYRTLKLDFLFGAALASPGGRFTSLESYQLWMKTIREAVPDLHLIGCGAPMLPSVGWFDSMRTGPDVAFVTAREPRYAFAAAQARHTALRAHTDRWWTLDPDVVLLRGTGIDDAEAWTHVVSAALSGGNWLLGDPRQASPLRRAMALDPEILAMVRDGRAARAIDLTEELDERLFLSPILDISGETRAPHLWRKLSTDGKYGWLAIFAWSEPYETMVYLPDDAIEIVPPAVAGAGAQRRPFRDQRVAVPRHQARLFYY